MKFEYWNPAHLGNLSPWFGPLLPGYAPVLSSGMPLVAPGIDHEVTAWVWDSEGCPVAEAIVGKAVRDQLFTFELEKFVSEVRSLSGTLGIATRPLSPTSKASAETWVLRYIDHSGKMAGIVFSGAPKNMNFESRSGRSNSYRMCSQELLINRDWKTLSWHGNVSSDPNYDKQIHARLFILDENGNQLEGPEQVINPFGSVLVDIEEVFGDRAKEHLASNGGRGNYMMHAKDGGAVGYHFLQNRRTGEIASDHTRPVPFYLSSSYGWTAEGEPASAMRLIKSAARVAKFRLEQRR
jgi:hypothetical protein